MHPWSAADISSVILRSQHPGVSLSPPNTPTPAAPVTSAPVLRSGNPAIQNPIQLQNPAAIARSQLRPITTVSAGVSSRDSPRLHVLPQPSADRSKDRDGMSHHGYGRPSMPLFSASTPRHAPAVEHGFTALDDAAEAAQERQVLDSLRKQAISNEVELLRQRLAIVHLELHNRNKDYELLQRAAAVSEYRAEVAERALSDLQQQVKASAVSKSRQSDASGSTSVENDRSGSGIDASTQTLAATQADNSGIALLQRLVAVPSSSPNAGSNVHASSISPQKHSSRKSSVSLEHVNAKADHLAEKLEELLFNMSVQQREFSKLSRAASGLFRTLVQTVQAVAHCYSILSGGHDEQVTQRRYMAIERELEGRDVAVFASEACVLIEDAIEAVNLVNMLRAPHAVQAGKK